MWISQVYFDSFFLTYKNQINGQHSIDSEIFFDILFDGQVFHRKAEWKYYSDDNSSQKVLANYLHGYKNEVAEEVAGDARFRMRWEKRERQPELRDRWISLASCLNEQRRRFNRKSLNLLIVFCKQSHSLIYNCVMENGSLLKLLSLLFL